METTNKSPSEILLEAARLIETEEKFKWSKGDLFKLIPPANYSSDAGCSMCAHGVIAYCGNSETRQKANLNPVSTSLNYAEDYANYQNVFMAHSIAKKVGLNYGFNDLPGRTKQEVIDKLREAANLSKL